jgi:branched-chain amino acid transport system substrate-binding protein
MLPALDMWAEEVNLAGGLLGRPVKLVVRDDQSREDLTRDQYRDLLQDERADLLFGPYSSALTLAALEVTEPRGRLLAGLAVSGDEIWEKGYRFCFGVYAPASRYFIGFLDLAARQGLKSLGIIHEKSSFPDAAAKGARDWAARFGLKVVFVEGYGDGARELPRLLEKAKQESVEALALAVYQQDSLLAVTELERMGWRPKALTMSTGPAAPDFYLKAGPAAENVFGPTQWEPNLRIPFPGMAKFIDGYTRRAGHLPSYHATSAYAGMTILAQAVQKVASLDQELLRRYIWNLDTISVMGRFKVDATGKQVGHTPFMIQWQGGKKEIVYPPRMLTAPARF